MRGVQDGHCEAVGAVLVDVNLKTLMDTTLALKWLKWALEWLIRHFKAEDEPSMMNSLQIC